MNIPASILIVDDDDTSNMITSVILKRNIEKAEIHLSMNGKEAIDFLTHLEDGYPELILLDINMPLINGFDFLEWFQVNCTHTNSLVSMFSTSSRQDEVDKAMAYDRVVDYIEKPLTKNKIADLLKKVNMKLKK